MSYPIFDLLSIHCSRLLNRKFSSFQTKFRQGVMLKYLIFVPKATVFILFLLYLLVIFIFLCFYLPSYYWFFFIFLLLFSFFIVAVFFVLFLFIYFKSFLGQLFCPGPEGHFLSLYYFILSFK